MPSQVKCTYCGKPAELANGTDLYPHREDLADKKFWRCVPCEAYVGCHRGTESPMGTLANKNLRAVRSEAHRLFDQVWRNGRHSRDVAYRMLARAMRISVGRCHIGHFSIKECRRVIHIVKGWGYR